MARPIASVHVDIAELLLEVSDIQGGDEELGKWLRQLVRCLAKRDPALHEYGGRLLVEAAKYASEVSEQRRQAALTKWEKINGTAHNAPASGRIQTDAPGSKRVQTDATDRTDQADQADRSVPPVSPPGGGREVCAEFEEARKAWPGVKRGYGPEYSNFKKKFGKRATEILPLLLPAIRACKVHAEKRARQEQRPPIYPHFQTWINQERWTAEYPGQAGTAAAEDGKARAQDHYREHGFFPPNTPSAWMAA